jgi:hypothetical protein
MPNWVDPLRDAHQHQTALIRFASLINTKLR